MKSIGIRELRQHLSRHLKRVKAGESLMVTERGHEVALLIPAGEHANQYAFLAAQFGATVPVGRLEDVAAKLGEHRSPAGTTDAYIAESRRPRE